MDQDNKRPVRSVYYRGKEQVLVTHAKHPNNAVCNAVRHMQTNDYNATLCEVFNADTGALYAVLKAGVKALHIIYKADIEGRAEW